jgi:hypothetical protein
MDPVSAIGIASGAITFLQVSFQFVRAVYDAYDGGKPGAYEAVGDVAEQMKTQASKLVSQNKSLHLIKDGAEIAALAVYCESLAAKIVKRVQQTKGESGRLRAAVNSAIKTLIHKGEISRLQAALDNCRAQLHLQLHLLSRYVVAQGMLWANDHANTV